MSRHTIFVGGKVVNTIVADEAFANAVAADLDGSATLIVNEADIRTTRNDLLFASDWTQVADTTADQSAWATYRQALRDVPQQSGFPSDVTWPEKP